MPIIRTVEQSDSRTAAKIVTDITVDIDPDRATSDCRFDNKHYGRHQGYRIEDIVG